MPAREPHIIAVYPGSFDPLTLGHLNIIRRAARLFNELIVGVGVNPDKALLFSAEERLALIEPHIHELPNVRAEAYAGLTIDFAKHCAARVLVRGIRDLADLSGEIQQAAVNQLIGGVETVFLLTSDQHTLTSSTYIKQIFQLGGGDLSRVKRLVPPNVADKLAEKLARTQRSEVNGPR
ncbi:Phosphopantetheine adenylyltransferase [Phycisphaerae bacterium RAS1]|nr:Phosphopantetheine adenylyltransferase [Phycisphaerae bacterium RAS1]